MFGDDKTLSRHWEFKISQSVVSLSVILRLSFAPGGMRYYIYVVRQGGGRGGGGGSRAGRVRLEFQQDNRSRVYRLGIWKFLFLIACSQK